MSRTVKKIWRYTKWPLFVIALLSAFWLWFVPFAQWVFVDKTLEVYDEVAEKYAQEGDDIQTYQGVITDTLISPSTTVKGKVDTVIHRQSVKLTPQQRVSDGKPKLEDVGVLGDSAGLLNAFFSFMAFMAVLLTIYLQSSKDGHDKQNSARMLFEQEFFAMVGMLENIVSHLKFTDNKVVEETKFINEVTNDVMKQFYGGILHDGQEQDEDSPEPKVVEGREVFRYLYADREYYNLRTAVSKQEDIRSANEAMDMCFDGTLDHYFRYLYRILRHIDESKLLGSLDDPQKEREYYAHVLRAQLSNYELLMLFYNGLLGENPKTIKKLIERYAMFNNLRAWDLGDKQVEYYQAIMEGEVYEDPKGIDLQTRYSVTAFWDEKKLREFKKEANKKDKQSDDFSLRLRRFFSGKKCNSASVVKGDESIEKVKEEEKPDATKSETPAAIVTKPKPKENTIKRCEIRSAKKTHPQNLEEKQRQNRKKKDKTKKKR